MSATSLIAHDLFGVSLTLAVQAGVCAPLFNLRGRDLGAAMLVSLTTTPLLFIIASFQGVFQWVVTATHVDSLGWFAGGILPLILLVMALAVIDWRLLVWALGPTAGSSRKLLWFAGVVNVVSALLAFPTALAVRLLLAPVFGVG